METWRTCCMQQKIKLKDYFLLIILWLNWIICNWKWRSESVVFAPVWDRTVIKSQDQVGRKFAVPVLLGNLDVSCSGLPVSTVQSRISESKRNPINIFPIIFLGDQNLCRSLRSGGLCLGWGVVHVQTVALAQKLLIPLTSLPPCTRLVYKRP